MPEFARRCYPATLRLKELLATSLGPPRLILGHSRLFGFDRYAVPGPDHPDRSRPAADRPGKLPARLVRVPVPVVARRRFSGSRCRGAPLRGRANAEPDFESFVGQFPGGATAQIAFGRYHRARWGEASRFLPASGFQVYAERGAAWLEMPERIQWWDSSGTHEERLPLEPTVGDVLNDQFHRLVHKGQSLAPTIHDALEIARLVQDLKQSQDRGSRRRSAGPVDRLRKTRRMGRTPSSPRTDDLRTRLPAVWLGSRPAAAAVVGLALLLGLDPRGARRPTTRSPTSAWRPAGGAPASRPRSRGWARPSRSGSSSRRRALVLDRLGRGELIDDPIGHQARAAAAGPAGALWIWLAALRLCGLVEPAALRPQGDGPGGLALRAQPEPDRPRRLVTMELPLWPARPACSSSSGASWTPAAGAGSGPRRRWAAWRSRASSPRSCSRRSWRSSGGSTAGGAEAGRKPLPRSRAGLLWEWPATSLVMLAGGPRGHRVRRACRSSRSTGDHPSIDAKFGGRLAAWIARLYETPVPQDWVGFATQVHHQMSGGSSYLLGERRMTGWWYYYFVALAVKVPLTFWLLLAGRAALAWRRDEDGPASRRRSCRSRSVCSWPSPRSARRGTTGCATCFRWRRWRSSGSRGWPRRTERPANSRGWPAWIVGLGLAGQALAVAAVHPFELTYFNVLAGGPIGRPTHPLRLEPRLGPGAQGAGPAPARGAGVSRPDALLLRRHRPGLLRRGGHGPRRECRRRPISTAGHPDRDDPLPGGLGLTPVGAVGTARVLSTTGLDRSPSG